MWYNFYLMRTALQTAFAYCLISTVACAAVAPHAKSKEGTLPDSCPASTFSATVWRGETAYVEIPAGVRWVTYPPSEASRRRRCPSRGGNGELVTGNREQNGVTVALGYYDEVAYEMQPGGVDIRKRPDVYREWGTGNGERVEEKIAEIAKRYHFFPSVRDPSFDFGGFRREVESLVNDSAGVE